MIFIDYTITVIDNKDIILDKELTLEKLGFKEGDRFELITIDGTVVFKKLASDAPDTTDTDDFWYRRKDSKNDI